MPLEYVCPGHIFSHGKQDRLIRFVLVEAIVSNDREILGTKPSAVRLYKL
jgi:hypothetical protein